MTTGDVIRVTSGFHFQSEMTEMTKPFRVFQLLTKLFFYIDRPNPKLIIIIIITNLLLLWYKKSYGNNLVYSFIINKSDEYYKKEMIFEEKL